MLEKHCQKKTAELEEDIKRLYQKAIDCGQENVASILATLLAALCADEVDRLRSVTLEYTADLQNRVKASRGTLRN